MSNKMMERDPSYIQSEVCVVFGYILQNTRGFTGREKQVVRVTPGK